jgi:hypothetical protein
VDKRARGLEFPCRFPIKVMGRSVEGFEQLVVETVRRHVGDLETDAVKQRESREGRYVSITVTFTASSREQLDALYRELSDCEHVAVVL